MDLISREALLNDLCEDREEGTFEFTDSQAEAADKIIVYVTERIDAQPTVDAVPVKHGRWEYSEKFKGYKGCSVCDNWFVPVDDFGGGKWAFCPVCGAKMDLEEQHEQIEQPGK